MGRAFLSTPYLPSAPPPSKLPSSLHRWSAKKFDPDQEDIGGLDMVYEAVLVPDAVLPESAVRTPLLARDYSIPVPIITNDAGADDASTSDGDSDSGTALSSPSSVTSNEAQQLASLQRRLFGDDSGARAGTGPGSPTATAPAHAAVPQSDTARRIQDHMATISSMFDRIAPPTASGRGPRRAATLSALDIITRPAVAQST